MGTGQTQVFGFATDLVFFPYWGNFAFANGARGHTTLIAVMRIVPKQRFPFRRSTTAQQRSEAEAVRTGVETEVRCEVSECRGYEAGVAARLAPAGPR